MFPPMLLLINTKYKTLPMKETKTSFENVTFFVSFQEQDDPNATHWPDHYIERINTMSCVSKSLFNICCGSSPESVANFIVWGQHHQTQFHNGLLCLFDVSH